MHLLIKRLLAVAFILVAFAQVSAQDTLYKTVKPKKNTDIMDRIDFGGYLGLQFGTVTIVDVSPLAAYHVTEKFHAGLGLTYQYYKDNRYVPEYSTSAYGGSIFARYFIWRDLFLHAEYAPLYVTYYDYYFDNSGIFSYRVKGNTWVNDILIGGGYRQMIGGKAYMSLMLLWNINETYYSPYRNPIIRIGFGVGL